MARRAMHTHVWAFPHFPPLLRIVEVLLRRQPRTRGAGLQGSIPVRSRHSRTAASAPPQAPLLGAHGPAPQPPPSAAVYRCSGGLRRRGSLLHACLAMHKQGILYFRFDLLLRLLHRQLRSFGRRPPFTPVLRLAATRRVPHSREIVVESSRVFHGNEETVSRPRCGRVGPGPRDPQSAEFPVHQQPDS